MTAADILARTRGSIVWASFYGVFVAAAAIHAAIGVRNVLTEWSPLDDRARRHLRDRVRNRAAGARIAGGGRGGAVMTARRLNHRRSVLWVAALVHRLSGLALAIFLPLHFLTLGLATRRRSAARRVPALERPAAGEARRKRARIPAHGAYVRGAAAAGDRESRLARRAEAACDHRGRQCPPSSRSCFSRACFEDRVTLERLETDILILGSGGAGLFAALHAHKANPASRHHRRQQGPAREMRLHPHGAGRLQRGAQPRQLGRAPFHGHDRGRQMAAASGARLDAGVDRDRARAASWRTRSAASSIAIRTARCTARPSPGRPSTAPCTRAISPASRSSIG